MDVLLIVTQHDCTERDTAITERDARPTVEQMQDARVGSIVVEKDWQSGEVSLSLWD